MGQTDKLWTVQKINKIGDCDVSFCYFQSIVFAADHDSFTFGLKCRALPEHAYLSKRIGAAQQNANNKKSYSIEVFFHKTTSTRSNLLTNFDQYHNSLTTTHPIALLDYLLSDHQKKSLMFEHFGQLTPKKNTAFYIPLKQSNFNKCDY
jgi:hypothetical protein